jgi:cell division protein FtsB
VQYHKVNAMLLNEVQKQHRQIGGHQAEIDDLKARVAAIERLLSSDRK